MDTDQVLKIKILLKGLIYYNIYIYSNSCKILKV
jgi:hypothetical protein